MNTDFHCHFHLLILYYMNDLNHPNASIEVDEKDRNPLRFFWLDYLEDNDVEIQSFLDPVESYLELGLAHSFCQECYNII